MPSLLAIEIDPDLARFAIHHYAHEKLAQPPTIEDWQKRTGHDVIFNAGLFRENFAYLGLLYKDGRSLGRRRHTTWQGVFVAEPLVSGVKKARVLDLAVEAFDEQHPPYQEAAQALMRPAPDDLLEAFEMHPQINDSRREEPGIQQPLQTQLLL